MASLFCHIEQETNWDTVHCPNTGNFSGWGEPALTGYITSMSPMYKRPIFLENVKVSTGAIA